MTWVAGLGGPADSEAPNVSATVGAGDGAKVGAAVGDGVGTCKPQPAEFYLSLLDL